jgi:hypothetical protein
VRSFLRQLTGSILTYASLIGLVYAVKPPDEGFSSWEKLLLAGATLVVLIDLALTVAKYLGRPERRYPSGRRQQKKIRDFMYNWIDSLGRVAVFTRDLTWVDSRDTTLITLLEHKAMNDDLIVVLPRHTDLTQRLQEIGADVITYPDLDYVIQSRFTVVGIGRAGSRVAIGHADGNSHVIEIVSSDNPSFYLAEDLVEVMRRI